MKPLSSNTTGLARTGIPILWGVLAGGFIIGTRGQVGWAGIILLGVFAYSVWFGRRLSDVWLDGDELVVQGRASFRVPLAACWCSEKPVAGEQRQWSSWD